MKLSSLTVIIGRIFWSWFGKWASDLEKTETKRESNLRVWRNAKEYSSRRRLERRREEGEGRMRGEDRKGYSEGAGLLRSMVKELLLDMRADLLL